MTTAEAIRLARSFGCRFELDGPMGVCLVAPSAEVRDMLLPRLRPHRDDIRAILSEHAPLNGADAVYAALHLVQRHPTAR
jgi:hypothetical protein